MSLTPGEMCAACAVLGCMYLLIAAGIVLFWPSSTSQDVHARPEAVTILKPLHGSEPRLAECLSSFCTQSYAAPTQLVFGVQDANDTALPAAMEIKSRFPAVRAIITIDGTSHGSNAKVSNLINMEPSARHGVLIASDGDILVRPHHIDRVMSLLQKPGAGAVSVLYAGEPGARLWSRLSAICINTHFLPNVLVGMALNLAKPCFGSTIALRRETLEAVGGFEAFANQLADDYAIGEAVRRAGYAVRISSYAAVHVCYEDSARELLHHQLRWARTIKTIDFPGYLGSFIAHPFPIAALGIAAGNRSCAGIAAVAFCLRIVLCKAVQRSFGLEPQNRWLLPVADLMLFSVYVWSFFGSAVTWKEAQYEVLADGTFAESRRG